MTILQWLLLQYLIANLFNKNNSDSKSMKIILLLTISLLSLSSVQGATVTVFAAASLTEPMEKIAASYQRQYKSKVITVYAASSTLARQISRGAPADIFISANQQWMQYLVEQQKIVAGSLSALLANQLVLVAPLNSRLQSIDLHSDSELAEQLQKGRLATGNTEHVPVGIYAKQALQSLNLWDQVKNRLAMANNTRAALAFAERSAVPLAIVYKTDALSSKKVKVLATFPATSHLKIHYPMALIDNKKATKPAVQKDQASVFYRYLKSAAATAIFRQYGFTGINNVN